MRVHRHIIKRAAIAAGIVAAAPVAVFVAGFSATGGSGAHAALTFGAVVAFAVLAGFLFAYDRKFLFTGIVMGFVIGTLFGADLLFEVPFEEQFVVSAMTLMYFVVLGTAVGAVAELIHLLHHAVHGGKIEHCVIDTEEAEDDDGAPVARK